MSGQTQATEAFFCGGAFQRQATPFMPHALLPLRHQRLCGLTLGVLSKFGREEGHRGASEPGR